MNSTKVSELTVIIRDGRGIELIWWISIHLNDNTQAEKELVKDVNVHRAYVNHYFFLSKIKDACSANVLKILLQLSAFITKPKTLDYCIDFYYELQTLINR